MKTMFSVENMVLPGHRIRVQEKGLEGRGYYDIDNDVLE
jgi:hypothetical protein